jgi:hypothetical protein
MRMSVFRVGVDLAQSSDYSAISALEVIKRGDQPVVYHLRHIERLPLKTPYPEQIRRIVQVCTDIGTRFGSLPALSLDFTGCGAPVFDMLRGVYSGSVTGILITAGTTETRDGQIIRVPKKNLIGGLILALENRQLRISSKIPASEILLKELQDFVQRIDVETAHTRFEARRGHDDLVMSLSIALYSEGGFYRARRDGKVPVSMASFGGSDDDVPFEYRGLTEDDDDLFDFTRGLRGSYDPISGGWR